ncbi:hypothetical protein PsorP6_005158 [Peronosclerospora sorghi]|uniref:Uncharacterized protein n=1 Tax=Peronosclerospora sorghi TaxID=230839 RepID=A0ACC0W4F3_9STRA|nr:hypothetical protein PsorP6_005158 [Peronosclerospora sorghi]
MSLFSAMADENSVWAQGSSLFNITSPLNDLLERENFTLEQVLEEDELVQEVKTRNTKLIDFLSREPIVQQLVEYIVRTPEDPSNAVRTIKYPYMSCEVLCCDISSITQTLVEASGGQIVETLFELLYETEKSVDARLAGYFEKIVTMLMVRKPQEMTTLLNKHSDELLAGFARHAANFSVAELLKRLLQPYQTDYMDDCLDFPGMAMGFPPPSNAWYGGDEDDGETGHDTPSTAKDKTLTWQCEPTVVELLLETLRTPQADSDAHQHASDVLVDIIQCGTRAQQTEPASPASSSAPVSFALLDYLETDKVTETLALLAVPDDDEDASVCLSTMTGAISVVSALLSRATKTTQYNAQDGDVPHIITHMIARIPRLCAILSAPDNERDMIRTQRHELVPRVGLRRLKLVGLVVLLLQAKAPLVDAAIIAHHVIGHCLDLFFHFEAVNLLHAEVESLVIGILESGSHDLLVELVREARLLPRILDAHAANDRATAVAKGFALGYMGHLHRLCHTLVTMLDDVRGQSQDDKTLNEMRHADTVLELFEEDEATWKAWEELVTQVLAPMYERERLPLGGVAIAPGTDDPYAVMGFTPHDELLNAQFAEMLGASGFGAAANGGDETVKEGTDADTPMLPEIMNDSSSSEEEDEDELARQGRATQGTDLWANLEAGGAWAKFDSTFDEIPFEPIPGMDTDEFDDGDEQVEGTNDDGDEQVEGANDDGDERAEGVNDDGDEQVEGADDDGDEQVEGTNDDGDEQVEGTNDDGQEETRAQEQGTADGHVDD